MYYSRVSRNVDVFLENIFKMYQDHSSTQVLEDKLGRIIHDHRIAGDFSFNSGILIIPTWPSRVPCGGHLLKWWKHPRIRGVICPQIIRDWPGFVAVVFPRRQGTSASPSLPRAAIAEMAREAMQKRQEGTPTRTLKANHVTNVVISILHYTSKKKPGDQNWKKLQWFIGVSLITI